MSLSFLCLLWHYCTMSLELSSWAQTSEYIMKDLCTIKEHDKVRSTASYSTFTAVNVISNNISDSAITRAEISGNIMNELDSTASTTAEISENIMNKTDTAVTHTIISTLTISTALTAVNTAVINAVNSNPGSTVTDLNADSDKLLKNMPSDIACRPISHWNMWLWQNSHSKITAEELMNITDKIMKEAQLTLQNSYWWDNIAQREISYTDKEEIKWDYLICYLSDVCKFTTICEFFTLYNLLSVVADRLSRDPSVKSVKNVDLTRIFCSMISNCQKVKTWEKNDNKKHQRMTDKVTIIAIENKDFKINSVMINPELDPAMIVKYYVTDNLRSIMSATNIIWLQRFETSLQHQFITNNLCNQHRIWLYQAFSAYRDQCIAFIVKHMKWEWTIVIKKWKKNLHRMIFSQDIKDFNIYVTGSDKLDYAALNKTFFLINKNNIDEILREWTHSFFSTFSVLLSSPSVCLLMCFPLSSLFVISFRGLYHESLL